MILIRQLVCLAGCLFPVSIGVLAIMDIDSVLAHSPIRQRLAAPKRLLAAKDFLFQDAAFDNQQLNQERILSYCLECRGGASSEDDETEDEYDDEYDEEGEGEATGMQRSSSSFSTVLGTLKNVLISTTKAISRALSAGIRESTSEKAGDTSLVKRVFQTLKSMVTAAFSPEGSSTLEEPKEQKSKSKKKSEKSTKDLSASDTTDFGRYLSRSYGVDDGRDSDDEKGSATTILGGTFNGALQKARANARLLVVLIPSAGPKAQKSADMKAIKSFLSAEVSTAAEKKARKSGETASFVLWGTHAGSTEAKSAMKRLKVTLTGSKGNKRPILLVAYPAQTMTPSGLPKMVPKVLAQHHCSPPPTPEAMAKWMNELRKRYSKQYAKMQLDVREAQLFKERKEGYKESVQSDVERKIREKREEEERLAKEKAEKERQRELENRRKELAESMPEEPGLDVKDAFTISIRHSDGRSSRRRFTPDTQLATVFDWVDVTFAMERETAILTTLNGKQTFNWDDIEEQSLSDGGFAKMVGFRVTEKKLDEKEAEAKKEDTGASSEDDEDEED